jgi:hypothetical protein
MISENERYIRGKKGVFPPSGDRYKDSDRGRISPKSTHGIMVFGMDLSTARRMESKS